MKAGNPLGSTAWKKAIEENILESSLKLKNFANRLTILNLEVSTSISQITSGAANVFTQLSNISSFINDNYGFGKFQELVRKHPDVFAHISEERDFFALRDSANYP